MRQQPTHPNQAADHMRWFSARDAAVSIAPIAPPRCSQCAKWTPDAINPAAGMGWCSHRDQGRYPGVVGCGKWVAA
ncbi:MAG: hypothetical protein ABW154_14280 [Dyella sp.]